MLAQLQGHGSYARLSSLGARKRLAAFNSNVAASRACLFELALSERS